MSIRKEASINQFLISVLSEFPGVESIDFSGLPNVAKLFEVISPANKEVGEPHQNLFTSENLYHGTDPNISGVWYQRINGNQGTIAEHDHEATQEHEILIFFDEPGYANIPSNPEYNKELMGLHIVFIPTGTRHGSNEEPSQGDWVSIKVKAN